MCLHYQENTELFHIRLQRILTRRVREEPQKSSASRNADFNNTLKILRA